MFKSAFLILIAFILVACASSGSKFNMADVDAMRPGQTTIEEAKAKLGPLKVRCSQLAEVWGWYGSMFIQVHSVRSHAVLGYCSTKIRR